MGSIGGKGETSTNQQSWGYMLIFGRVDTSSLVFHTKHSVFTPYSKHKINISFGEFRCKCPFQLKKNIYRTLTQISQPATQTIFFEREYRESTYINIYGKRFMYPAMCVSRNSPDSWVVSVICTYVNAIGVLAFYTHTHAQKLPPWTI